MKKIINAPSATACMRAGREVKGRETVGHQDPGASSFDLIFKSAVEYLAGRPGQLGDTEENR